MPLDSLLTGILISRNVSVWFILTDMDKAKTPARVIRGFWERSRRESVEFSGRHSAKAMAALESRSVLERFNSRKKWFLERAHLIAWIYDSSSQQVLSMHLFVPTPWSESFSIWFPDISNTCRWRLCSYWPWLACDFIIIIQHLVTLPKHQPK